jgi:hypothetical protein
MCPSNCREPCPSCWLCAVFFFSISIVETRVSLGSMSTVVVSRILCRAALFLGTREPSLPFGDRRPQVSKQPCPPLSTRLPSSKRASSPSPLFHFISSQSFCSLKHCSGAARPPVGRSAQWRSVLLNDGFTVQVRSFQVRTTTPSR